MRGSSSTSGNLCEKLTQHSGLVGMARFLTNFAEAFCVQASVYKKYFRPVDHQILYS
jgi:hypothetical protein